MDKLFLKCTDGKTCVLPSDILFYKPLVKGVDYWTPADQESIVQDVIRALGTPVFGRVDAENNIILTGNLVDGTYTIKYEDADGNVIEIGTLNHTNEPASYTNQIPISTDVNGSIYNEVGYKAATRINSSGQPVDYTDYQMYASGFIPCRAGDIIRLKNITWQAGVDSQNNQRIACYDANKNYLNQGHVGTISALSTTVKDGNKIVQQFTLTSDGESFDPTNAAYIRISATYIGAHSILTVNEEITDSEAPDTGYTNQIPLSTEADGVTPYNGGLGYKENTRHSASGGGDVTAAGITVSGYISVSNDDIIRVKNITMNKNSTVSNSCHVWYTTDGDATGANVDLRDASASAKFYPVFDDEGNLIQFTIPHWGIVTIRLNTAYIGPDSILTINQPIEADGGASYTNQIPISTDIDGTIYNGIGYKANSRYSSGSGADITYNGCYVTGYIPVKKDQTIRVANMTMDKNAADGNWCFGYMFDANKANAEKIQVGTGGAYTFDDLGAVWDANGHLSQFTIPADGFIRLQASYIGPDSIITINEEIPEDDEPTDTNLLLSATDVDGTIYNGTGYKEGIRINSSGQAVEATGCVSTGFIPVKHGDTINLYNILYPLSDTPLSGTELDGVNYKIALYSSDKTALSSTSIIELGNSTGLAYVADENDFAKAITLVGDDSGWWGNVAYFRITATEITSESVITVHDGSTGLGDIGAFALTWTDGIKIDKTTGAESSESAYAASQMFDITDGYNYTASQINRYGYSAGGITICYYDANETYLGYEELWPATPPEPHSELLTPLEGAVKFRLRLYHGEGLDARFYSLTYEKKISYTNLIPLSINSDGSAYVGTNGEDGYKTSTRLNSSGAETAITNSNIWTTGFMPIKKGDTIYVDHLDWVVGGPSSTYSACYISTYREDFSHITGGTAHDTMVSNVTETYEVDPETNQLISLTLDGSAGNIIDDVAWFRMSFSHGSGTAPIITVNQPIV